MKRVRIMRPGWYRFCQFISKLDSIPRYGRLYRYEGAEQFMESLELPKRLVHKRHAHWTFRRHGFWGLNLLNRWGMLSDFIDEGQLRHLKGVKAMKQEKEKFLDFKKHRQESWLIVAMGVLVVTSVLCLVLAFTLL